MPVVDGLPVAVHRWHVPPANPAPGPPEQPVDHCAVISPSTSTTWGLIGQQGLHPVPLCISQVMAIEHALIRLDAVDPDRPDEILAPPAEITAQDLAELVAGSASSTGFHTPGYADTGHAWPIAWGPQLDVRPVNAGSGQITSEAVAAYLAKVRDESHRTHRAACHCADERRDR